MLPRSTMISSNKGVLITGGQFNQYNYHGQASLGNKELIDVLMGAVATKALHDSGASFDKPKCHPRTRVKIREIIMRWIALRRDKDDEAGKQFMWLNGAAGCGKSAIAQSTIEACIERGLPLSSFFFNRSDSTRNHAGSLVATLAYQLYCAFPETAVQAEILSAIKKDPLIFKKTLQQQFTSLIIRPLMNHFSKDQSTQHHVPFLIVIDGLDECTDRNAQKGILIGLAESLRNSNLCIPIFVASRPEHDIKLSFGSKFLKDIHTVLSLDLEDEDAYSDIKLYLFDRLATIKDDFDNRTIGRKLSQDWPGDEVIETLVWRSSCQFIYAATVIRYVESTRHRPDHRLDVVLNLRPVNGEHPFAQLDSLYAMILESALDIEKVLHVLSLHLIANGISFSLCEKLLSYDEGEVETLFCDMGALIEIYQHTKDELRLRFLHASFSEYLLDAARSKQFHINMEYERIKHATHMFQHLASCCSSSFNPYSNASDPMYILCKIQSQIMQHIGHITISLELQQSILSFPLKEFLEPHTSTSAYPKLLEVFVTPFLELLEAMVLNNPALSYIQDHQLKILRSALLPQIQQYFNNDWQALVLVLFYHLGSNRFVPIIKFLNTEAFFATPLYPEPYPDPDLDEHDILALSGIWIPNNSSLNNVYNRYVRQLLGDPCQTTKYALGAVMHEKAALFCFKELARMVPLLQMQSPSGKNIDIVPVTLDNAEDDYQLHRLSFNSGEGAQQLWEFQYSWDWQLEDKDYYFLLLGYAIFLLPCCGRSDALVAACEDRTWTTYIKQLPDDPSPSDDPFPPDAPFPPEEFFLQDDPFPVRRRLFNEEIKKYLARVSPNCMSESCI